MSIHIKTRETGVRPNSWAHLQQVLNRAEESGNELLKVLNEKTIVVTDIMYHFNIIQSAIKHEDIKQFYELMIDMLEFFSVDYKIILDVITECFNVTDETEVECLINAHYRYRTECFRFLTAEEKENFLLFVELLDTLEPASRGIDLIEHFYVCVLCDINLKQLNLFQKNIILAFKQLAETPDLQIVDIKLKRDYILVAFKKSQFVFNQLELLHTFFLNEKKIHHKVEQGKRVDESRVIISYCLKTAYSIPQIISFGQVLCAVCYNNLGIYEKTDWPYFTIIASFLHMILYKIFFQNAKELNFNKYFLIHKAHGEINHLLKSFHFSIGMAAEIYMFLSPMIIYVITNLQPKKVQQFLSRFQKVSIHLSWKNIALDLYNNYESILNIGMMGALSIQNKNIYLLVLSVVHSGIKYLNMVEIMDRTKYLRWFHKFDNHFGKLYYQMLYVLQLRSKGWNSEDAKLRPAQFIKDVEIVEKAIDSLFEIATTHNDVLRYTIPLHAISEHFVHRQKEFERESYVRTNAEMQLLSPNSICLKNKQTMHTFFNTRSSNSAFEKKKWNLQISREGLAEIVKLL